MHLYTIYYIVDGVILNTFEINFVRFGFAALLMLLIALIVNMYTRVHCYCNQGQKKRSFVSWYVFPIQGEMKRYDWERIILGK